MLKTEEIAYLFFFFKFWFFRVQGFKICRKIDSLNVFHYSRLRLLDQTHLVYFIKPATFHLLGWKIDFSLLQIENLGLSTKKNLIPNSQFWKIFAVRFLKDFFFSWIRYFYYSCRSSILLVPRSRNEWKTQLFIPCDTKFGKNYFYGYICDLPEYFVVEKLNIETDVLAPMKWIHNSIKSFHRL